ncbi:MAG: MBL fold metallo-hydrolase [Deltaproteobacteria bacterium]|nr:MBL fold metallo-hydrolase [Deltaproteobacteria bacterium]
MRSKKILVVCVLSTLLASSVINTLAEDEKISPDQVSENIYMIAGKGGNVGIFIGDDGTFLVDDNFAPMTEKIVAAIKSVGGDFPKFLINTHYHGDHTGGNENFGRGGTLIFSHDTVRERLKLGSFVGAFNMKAASVAPEGLPVVTFAEGISFHLNNDSIRAIHVAEAHTDGDSFIHFENANVIHSGDIFFNGFYPFIDVNHGGSLKGTIKAVDKILAMADDNTKIIAGHGPLGDKAQLMEYRQMLGIAYERLSKLKADGKTAQEAVAARPLADLEETWGDGIFTGDRWIELIYTGV